MVTIDDLQVHILKFGIDTFPPIEIPAERTRLNLFFEELTARWPDIYSQLIASSERFQISASFGPARATIPTFELLPRGPVFLYPVKLQPPHGETNISERAALETFAKARDIFARAVPGRKCMRVGLVREAVFGVEESLLHNAVTGQEALPGTKFVGGESLAAYRDDRCNVRIKIATVQIARQIAMPVGMSVTEPAGHGLHVELDVNNAEIRPLEDADIESIVERAASLWPNALVNYIKERLAQ